jgi:hypothetical protein
MVVHNSFTDSEGDNHLILVGLETYWNFTKAQKKNLSNKRARQGAVLFAVFLAGSKLFPPEGNPSQPRHLFSFLVLNISVPIHYLCFPDFWRSPFFFLRAIWPQNKCATPNKTIGREAGDGSHERTSTLQGCRLWFLLLLLDQAAQIVLQAKPSHS